MKCTHITSQCSLQSGPHAQVIDVAIYQHHSSIGTLLRYAQRNAHTCVLSSSIPTQVMDVAIYQHHSCIRKLAVMYGGYESNTEVRQGRARSSALLMDVAAKMEQGIAWPDTSCAVTVLFFDLFWDHCICRCGCVC